MKKYLIIFVLILIQSCSSGGDDGATPTASDTVFPLFKAGTFTEGYTDTTTYWGTDTAGGGWSGTYSVQVQAQSTFLGESAIPVLQKLQLTNSAAGLVISNIGTAYWSTSVSDRRYLGYSDASTTTVSATTTTIPETAKIGDFGVVGTYTDNAGSVVVKSWRIDDAGNGLAYIVQLSHEKDQYGNLEISSITKTLIDTYGQSNSTVLVVFYADIDEVLTLHGR